MIATALLAESPQRRGDRRAPNRRPPGPYCRPIHHSAPADSRGFRRRGPSCDRPAERGLGIFGSSRREGRSSGDDRQREKTRRQCRRADQTSAVAGVREFFLERVTDREGAKSIGRGHCPTEGRLIALAVAEHFRDTGKNVLDDGLRVAAASCSVSPSVRTRRDPNALGLFHAPNSNARNCRLIAEPVHGARRTGRHGRSACRQRVSTGI